MRDLEGAWVVRVTDLPRGWAEGHSAVAVNCHVRVDVTDLDGPAIAAAMAATGTPKHARELDDFAHQMRVSERVIALSGKHPRVLLGEVVGPYAYRPDLLPEQPHQRVVRWIGETTKAELEAQGLVRPSLGQAYAVGRLSRVSGPSAGSRQAPAAGGPTKRRVTRVRRPVVGTVSGRWQDVLLHEEQVVICPESRCDRHTTHRYLLEVPLDAPAPAGKHVLVVGANPSCPDEAWSGNFLRSLQSIAHHLDASSMGIVNLLTRRTRKLEDLRLHDPHELVGPRQHQTLDRALDLADVVLLAHGVGHKRGAVGAAFEAERKRLHEALSARVVRGTSVLTVGERPSHPRSWSFGPGHAGDRLQVWKSHES